MTKRITSIIILLALLLTLAGCYDTSYAAKSGDIQITPGIYLMLQFNAYRTMYDKMNVDGSFEKLTIRQQMKELSPLDERDVLTWVKTLTIQDISTFIAVEKLFAEKGFTLTAEEQQEIKDNAEKLYNEDAKLYEENGISQSSYTAWMTNNYKYKAIFKSMYYEDGTNPVSIADQKKSFAENYAQIKTIEIPIVTYDSQSGYYVTMSDDEISDLEAKATEMVTRINSGTSIDVVNAEWEVAQGYVEKPDEVEPIELSTFLMDDSYYTGNMIEELKALEFNKAAYEKDTNAGAIFVYQKFDPLATEKFFEYFKDKVIHKMKQSEYITYLHDYLGEDAVVTNQSVMNKYSPYNIKMFETSSES